MVFALLLGFSNGGRKQTWGSKEIRETYLMYKLSRFFFSIQIVTNMYDINSLINYVL